MLSPPTEDMPEPNSRQQSSDELGLKVQQFGGNQARRSQRCLSGLKKAPTAPAWHKKLRSELSNMGYTELDLDRAMMVMQEKEISADGAFNWVLDFLANLHGDQHLQEKEDSEQHLHEKEDSDKENVPPPANDSRKRKRVAPVKSNSARRSLPSTRISVASAERTGSITIRTLRSRVTKATEGHKTINDSEDQGICDDEGSDDDEHTESASQSDSETASERDSRKTSKRIRTVSLSGPSGRGLGSSCRKRSPAVVSSTVVEGRGSRSRPGSQEPIAVSAAPRTRPKTKVQQFSAPTRTSKRNTIRRSMAEETSSAEESEDSATIESGTDAECDSAENKIEKVLQMRLDSEQEYLVKYEGKSYHEVAWIKACDFVDQKDIRKRSKFIEMQQAMEEESDEFGAPFNPDYLLIDRVVAVEGSGDATRYLVKWKSLNYDEATWEKTEFVQGINKCKREFFERFEKGATAATMARKQRQKPVPVNEHRWKDDLKLRDYQETGVSWIFANWTASRNVILADEMGLGKTVQTAALLEYVKKYGAARMQGPSLIIVPLSTVENWNRECRKWTDMNCIVYTGNAAAREIIRKYEFHPAKGKRNAQAPKFEMLITTPEVLLSDVSTLRFFEWANLIVDEAHRLKNAESKFVDCLRQLRYGRCLLLTGTPIQNNTQELWSLLNFVDTKQFGDREKFLHEFGNMQNAEQLQALHNAIRPYFLRRLKEDVETSIPKRNELILNVELTLEQRKVYRCLLEQNFAKLLDGAANRNLANLRNISMELRKACNHPFLVKGIEDVLTEQTALSEEEQNEYLVNSSGKLILLDKLLPYLKSSGHRVLIFSQFVIVLNILERYLNIRKHKFERIDGSIRGEERQAAIDRFCTAGSDRFVFLVSTKAGGVGINLTAADTVIIFDSDWNPQNDIQAMARCHRIGQTQEVTVFRLIVKKSYEGEMFERASKKLGLDEAVLSNMTGDEARHSVSMSKQQKKELEELLKRGAYAAISSEADTDLKEFCEADIQKIIRQATTISHSPASNGTVAGLSCFATATFRSNGGDVHCDVNDPNFWDKLLPEAAETKAKAESTSEPRGKRTAAADAMRRSRSIAGDNGEDSSDSEDDSEGDVCRRRRGKNARHARGEHLTQKQRDRFVQALLKFGWGRWQEIACDSSLARRSESELENYARALLELCREHAPNAFLAVSSLIPSVAAWGKCATPDARPVFLTPPHTAPEHCVVDVAPDTVEKDSASPTLVQSAAAGTPLKHNLLYVDEPSLTEKPFQRKVAKNASMWLRRLAHIAILQQLLQQQSPTVPACPDPDLPVEWGAAEDVDLLRATLQHGIGEEVDLLSLSTLSFAANHWSPKTQIAASCAHRDAVEGAISSGGPSVEVDSAGAANASRVLPPTALLQRRVERLLSELYAQRFGTVVEPSAPRKRCQLDRDHNESDSEFTGSGRKARRPSASAALTSVWSKQEAARVIRALTLYGEPADDAAWELVKLKAGVKSKSVEMMKDFFAEYYADCKHAAALDTLTPLLSDQEPMSPTNADAAAASGPKHKSAVHFVRVMRVTRALRHRTICLDNLAARVSRISTPVGRVPSWWRHGSHDCDLLLGVAKHGFYMHDIFADPNLSFKIAIEEAERKLRLAVPQAEAKANEQLAKLAALDSNPTGDVDGVGEVKEVAKAAGCALAGKVPLLTAGSAIARVDRWNSILTEAAASDELSDDHDSLHAASGHDQPPAARCVPLPSSRPLSSCTVTPELHTATVAAIKDDSNLPSGGGGRASATVSVLRGAAGPPDAGPRLNKRILPKPHAPFPPVAASSVADANGTSAPAPSATAANDASTPPAPAVTNSICFPTLHTKSSAATIVKTAKDVSVSAQNPCAAKSKSACGGGKSMGDTNVKSACGGGKSMGDTKVKRGGVRQASSLSPPRNQREPTPKAVSAGKAGCGPAVAATSTKAAVQGDDRKCGAQAQQAATLKRVLPKSSVEDDATQLSAANGNCSRPRVAETDRMAKVPKVAAGTSSASAVANAIKQSPPQLHSSKQPGAKEVTDETARTSTAASESRVSRKCQPIDLDSEVQTARTSPPSLSDKNVPRKGLKQMSLDSFTFRK